MIDVTVEEHTGLELDDIQIEPGVLVDGHVVHLPVLYTCSGGWGGSGFGAAR